MDITASLKSQLNFESINIDNPLAKLYKLAINYENFAILLSQDETVLNEIRNGKKNKKRIFLSEVYERIEFEVN